MVLRYRRLPAALVLVVGLCAGIFLVLFRNGAFAATDPNLADLEREVATGHMPADRWLTYAQLLFTHKQFGKAWHAYEKVLQSQPYNRTARFEGTLALARSGDQEALYTFLRSLVYSEPKLAVELFDRKELSVIASEARFKALEKEARSQAMD